MKKYVCILLLLLINPVLVYAATTAGVINTIVTSNTKALVQITTLASDVDSVYIGRLVVGVSDTVFTVVDSTATSLFVSGLNPWTQHEFIMIARKAGVTALSDPDTVRIYAPEIELFPNSTALNRTERVITATSWRPTDIISYLTVDGTNAGDSSAVYRTWNRNALTVVATQDGDSVATMIYVHYGYREPTQKGDWIGFPAASESLNVTSIGSFGKTFTAGVTSPSMYLTTGGYAGNGKNGTLSIYITRDRY
ncbi:MAG TPA: hypothetical protein ENH82_12380 [bacterium]|nr:hypothetical protein [bacterium]